tara:strand:- start:260 stop:493 length:234 start_codon:yes stop_codon:yes gene_type:complete
VDLELSKSIKKLQNKGDKMTKEFNIILVTVILAVIFSLILVNANTNREPELSIDIPEPVIEEVQEKVYEKYEMGNYR